MYRKPLTDEEFEELNQALDPENLGEGAMDLVEAHGLLTAVVAGPAAPPEEEWLELVLGEAPAFDTPAARERTVELLRRLKGEIDDSLSVEGGGLELPFEPELGEDPQNSDLRAWCLAFMEGHLLTEEAWFADDEETVGELLLPAAALSGMLEDELGVDDDPALAAKLIDELPETVADLYFHFRLPPSERGGSAAKGKKKKR